MGLKVTKEVIIWLQSDMTDKKMAPFDPTSKFIKQKQTRKLTEFIAFHNNIFLSKRERC